MFSNIIALPIALLRIVSVWDESIERYVPPTVFKVYGFLIRFIFVYVSAICESVHLKAFESFEVCFQFICSSAILINLEQKLNVLLLFFSKKFCDNFSIATSIFNISVKMFAIDSKINNVYTLRNDMDSSIFQPRDKMEQRYSIYQVRIKKYRFLFA